MRPGQQPSRGAGHVQLPGEADYWHLSGIQRSVRLVAKPAPHLRDGAHKVRFDAAFRDATLVARAWIAPPSGRWELTGPGMVYWPAVRRWTVAFSLLDSASATVAEAVAELADRWSRTPAPGS